MHPRIPQGYSILGLPEAQVVDPNSMGLGVVSDMRYPYNNWTPN